MNGNQQQQLVSGMQAGQQVASMGGAAPDGANFWSGQWLFLPTKPRRQQRTKPPAAKGDEKKKYSTHQMISPIESSNEIRKQQQQARKTKPINLDYYC